MTKHNRGLNVLICRQAISMSVFLMLICSGCAVNRDIRVESDPVGADVYASSKLLGTTPLITDMDALFPNRAFDFHLSASRTLIFKKDGYKDATVAVTEFSVPPVINVTLEDLTGMAYKPRQDESIEARLKELDRLYDKGLVTDEEYRAKRQSILTDL